MLEKTFAELSSVSTLTKGNLLSSKNCRISSALKVPSEIHMNRVKPQTIIHEEVGSVLNNLYVQQ